MIIEDVFFLKSKNLWCAVISSTPEECKNFPIKVGDILEGGQKVIDAKPFSLSFMANILNKQSMGLLLDKEIEKGTFIKVPQYINYEI